MSRLAALVVAAMLVACGTAAPPPEPASDLPDPPPGAEVVTRDGRCWYVRTIRCEPEVPCQPPAPTPVKCPADGD